MEYDYITFYFLHAYFIPNVWSIDVVFKTCTAILFSFHNLFITKLITSITTCPSQMYIQKNENRQHTLLWYFKNISIVSCEPTGANI